MLVCYLARTFITASKRMEICTYRLCTANDTIILCLYSTISFRVQPDYGSDFEISTRHKEYCLSALRDVLDGYLDRADEGMWWAEGHSNKTTILVPPPSPRIFGGRSDSIAEGFVVGSSLWQ